MGSKRCPIGGMAMRRFWDTRGYLSLSGITRTPEIAALAVSICKKREHKCQLLYEKEPSIGLRWSKYTA